MTQVYAELQAGRKRSHWMWYIFPQLAGLGTSAMALQYGISGLEEARAFLSHAILGDRLIGCTDLVNRVEEKTAQLIFGSPDDLKFRSCMTLFAAADPAAPVFQAALTTYFGGVPDRLTLERLATT